MQVVENEKKFLGDFIRLNEEWISTYFELEHADLALAQDPYRIREDGGYIFSLVSEGTVLGVCALFNEGNGVFELARMAVSPNSQGSGFGDRLMQACLSKLDSVDAHKVYLLSNTKLEAAVALYKKHGFKTVSQGPHPVYSRANIVMERDVS